MDIKCRKCGEPWDMDELHSAVDEGDYDNYDEAARAFREVGCEAFYGASHNGNTAHPGIGILADLAGDDMDGFASDLEDFDYVGMFD